MNGFREDLQPENNDRVIVSKKADQYISDTQEHLWEAMNQEKYKEQSIDYRLNDVFWLSERQKYLLRTKVDFNKRVSIKDLLEETGIKNRGRNLTIEPVINLAYESLNEKGMDMFIDYLEENHIIDVFKKVSIEKFLELLSWFEEERPQTINDRALECLKFDESEKLRIYCQNAEEGYNWDETIMTRKGFEELLELKKAHDLEKDSLLS